MTLESWPIAIRSRYLTPGIAGESMVRASLNRSFVDQRAEDACCSECSTGSYEELVNCASLSIFNVSHCEGITGNNIEACLID